MRSLPPAPFKLILSNSPATAELVSPYVRDLGHALTRWGIENADRLRTDGLAEALIEHRDAPNLDLAAMVVYDLFSAHPDLLQERRDNERKAGVWADRLGGTAFGWLDVSASRAVDGCVGSGDENSIVTFVAGGRLGTIEAAAAALVESHRVAQIGVCWGLRGLSGPVASPAILFDDRDAFRNETHIWMTEIARQMLNCSVSTTPLSLGRTGNARRLRPILSLIRRGEILDRIANKDSVLILTNFLSKVNVESEMWGFLGGKIVISALTDPGLRQISDTDNSKRSLRFRP